MKQLISVITTQILHQIKPNEINMIRLECFNNPIIYKAVCEALREHAAISNFIAKLTLEKYNQFEAFNNPNWQQALIFLHTGDNSAYSRIREGNYDQQSYIDFEQAITKWRNESPNLPKGQTSLILLMGTEAAPDDAGSLKDTTFVISPREIIASLHLDYSKWFSDILIENAIDNADSKNALHTLYRVIFANVNIDLFKFSDFIDSLHSMPFVSCQELISYICETLNDTWAIPSIVASKSVPKVHALCTGKMTAAKIITNAIKFITRADDIPSAAMVKKLQKKFDVYADSENIDPTAMFPENTSLFATYDEFEKCVLDFMRGIELDTNRAMLLKVDFAIIDRIIGTKLKSTPSEKATVVTGYPMEAYSRIFLSAAECFHSDFNSYPTRYTMRIDRISLSDCVDEQKEDAFRNLCGFLGGILSFFNSSNIVNDDDLVEFSYDNGEDAFDFSNHNNVLDKVRSTGKWGEPCKIRFTINAANGNGSHNYEYVWAFSPYSPWLNAFSYLQNILFRKGEDSYTLPTMIVCENITDFLRCESEEEFYAQLGQIDDSILYRKHCKEIHRYFAGSVASGLFDKLCADFKDFAVALDVHGLYAALNELRVVVDSYTALMHFIQENFNQFTDVQQEKTPLLLNCFIIASNENVLDNGNMGEVLFPSYNPVMLEKIDAQQIFLRDGFAELMNSMMEGDLRTAKLWAKLESLVLLSSITQGTDFIIKCPTVYLTCKSMWEYYGVYFDSDTSNELLSGSAFGNSIVTDDEDAAAMLHLTPVSMVVVRNVMDYIRTFPARIDGLNVAFMAPTDMQHIVAAIHVIAKTLENSETPATINLRIICLNSKKNSATYLRKWLDSYFDGERKVNVNTFLRNITISDKSDAEVLNGLLSNCDLCFNYDILKAIRIQFDITGDEIIDKHQAKFPMTFTPDTIPATHGKSRKVSISQFQFLAAKEHTQAGYTYNNPHSTAGIYRTFTSLELTDIESRILGISHESCRWVVCIDSAIDRRMLETNKSRIIGFTTGEGSYGELNVTVSARQDILTDIKVMLQKRIKEKFTNWPEARLQQATKFCVDELSQYMDGSRILKALNPYDYEIHNYLANILTLQMLGLSREDEGCAVRALISLDSYKHWFTEDDELSKDNKRPDFMLIEIPKTADNFDPSSILSIRIKIIECKMGFQNNSHLVKARSQLEKGLRTMCINWSPDNTNIMHRYWLNQLYRAIIFSPLSLDNTSSEYTILRNKIYGILSGKYKITWSGDVFAFWLDSDSDTPNEWVVDSTLPEEMSEYGVDVESLICHECGQLFIQKMLLPPEERNSVFTKNDIANPEEWDLTDADDDTDENEGEKTPPTDTVLGSTIPAKEQVCLPYLEFLGDGLEHTRQESLNWFGAYFNVSTEDKSIRFESNGHYKWETSLDWVITLFRQSKLIENSQIAHFHITAFGHGFLQSAKEILESQTFEAAIGVYQNQLQQKIDVPSKTDSSNNKSSSNNASGGSDENTKPVVESKLSLSDVRFLIGEDIRTKEKYYWEFGNASLNNRHLLINGNSGCGKTYCIQTLLLEMVHAGVSGVVFDYTSGFTPDKLDSSFTQELGDKLKQRVVYIDKIPVNPFAKQTVKVGGIEVPEADTFVATRLANVFTTVYGFGGQQKSALYKAIKNGLQSHKDAMSFSYLEDELNKVSAKQAETVLSKIQPFLDLEPFAEDEAFDWSSIRDSDGMVYVMQLDGFDRPTQLLLTELLLWDIWNYCVKNGNEDHPFVIVLDEAQNLSHDAESPSAKFLTEGRKFGISAWYATQFMKPQLSDDEIQRLQQAGQKLYFCPPDDGVMTVAKNIDIDAQGAKEWAPKLKSLKKGECVTCGNMIKNGKWSKYEPRIVRVTSLQERLNHV